MALQICYLRVDESGFLPSFRCTNMISIPQSQTFGLVYVFNFFLCWSWTELELEFVVLLFDLGS